MAASAQMNKEETQQCYAVEARIIEAFKARNICPSPATLGACLMLIAHFYADEAHDGGAGRAQFIDTCVKMYTEIQQQEREAAK